MWSVTYTDGTSLQEFDASRPDGRGWIEIGAKPVGEVHLTTHTASQSHQIEVPIGAQPVFFRRRSIAINPTSGQEESRSTVHCIGWKSNEDAEYLFVYNNGETLLTNESQAV